MAQRGPQIGEHQERLRQHESLEATLGVTFAEKDLLRLALAHSSYLNEEPGVFPQSNERLEFLGDAVLGVVVAHELYHRHPEWPEGELTEARSALVRWETLAGAAKSLRLGPHLYMGKGEEAGGGRERPSNLAAALEALVGALFLDQGYEAARDFVLRVFLRELSTVGRHPVAKSPKSALQEIVQGRGMPPPSYRIVDAVGSEQARRFTAEVTVDGRVVGLGTGTRKSQAEQEAAAEALKTMDEQG